MDKRKVLIFILVCVLAASLFALVGCKERKGEQGEQGVRGDGFWTEILRGLPFIRRMTERLPSARDRLFCFQR